jgi:hypothetical protein
MNGNMMYICFILSLTDQAKKSRVPVGTDTAIRICKMLDEQIFFGGTLCRKHVGQDHAKQN